MYEGKRKQGSAYPIKNQFITHLILHQKLEPRKAACDYTKQTSHWLDTLHRLGI